MTTFRRGAAAVAAGLMVLGGAGTAAAQPEENTNNAAYWVDFLEAEGFVDVTCEKAEGDYSAYGEHEAGVDLFEDGTLYDVVWSDYAWLLAVVKAGSTGTSVEDENTLFPYVEVDDALFHESGKEISHIIFCDGSVPDEEPEQPTEEPEQPTEEPEQPTEEPEQPTEEPGTPGGGGDDAGKPIGPVVQTDVPVQGADPALPLAALAAAGLGLAALGLRRRGQES
ncbi:hypothetical protein [Ornithinimicrobium cerasi]|uniref:hypothetical protein n=1 Tax=Ornithinimicrobium cerasi TaxID=2248773 RepID=UPI000EFDBCE2|nr:hypothetical protein [Ornithinimicrobium cerasi]